jgi:hypothetical protein
MSADLIPTASVELATDIEGVRGFRVKVVWPGVDRPSTKGWVLGNRKTAERLAAAINAGAVFSDPEIRTDRGGQTYVSAHYTILGRTASADLARLGF